MSTQTKETPRSDVIASAQEHLLRSNFIVTMKAQKLREKIDKTRKKQENQVREIESRIAFFLGEKSKFRAEHAEEFQKDKPKKAKKCVSRLSISSCNNDKVEYLARSKSSGRDPDNNRGYEKIDFGPCGGPNVALEPQAESPRTKALMRVSDALAGLQTMTELPSTADQLKRMASGASDVIVQFLQEAARRNPHNLKDLNFHNGEITGSEYNLPPPSVVDSIAVANLMAGNQADTGKLEKTIVSKMNNGEISQAPPSGRSPIAADSMTTVALIASQAKEAAAQPIVPKFANGEITPPSHEVPPVTAKDSMITVAMLAKEQKGSFRQSVYLSNDATTKLTNGEITTAVSHTPPLAAKDSMVTAHILANLPNASLYAPTPVPSDSKNEDKSSKRQKK